MHSFYTFTFNTIAIWHLSSHAINSSREGHPYLAGEGQTQWTDTFQSISNWFLCDIRHSWQFLILILSLDSKTLFSFSISPSQSFSKFLFLYLSLECQDFCSIHLCSFFFLFKLLTQNRNSIYDYWINEWKNWLLWNIFTVIAHDFS